MYSTMIFTKILEVAIFSGNWVHFQWHTYWKHGCMFRNKLLVIYPWQRQNTGTFLAQAELVHPFINFHLIFDSWLQKGGEILGLSLLKQNTVSFIAPPPSFSHSRHLSLPLQRKPPIPRLHRQLICILRIQLVLIILTPFPSHGYSFARSELQYWTWRYGNQPVKSFSFSPSKCSKSCTTTVFKWFLYADEVPLRLRLQLSINIHHLPL